MKNKLLLLRPIPPALLILAAIAARAAVPVEWTADIDHPAPAQFAVMRGEAVRLRASLVRGGAPYDPAAESAALYYQTNGMGGTWWSAPATVSSNVLTADFTAAMDPGAPSVTAFLAATDADGSIYRAFATLRFLHAPGATPNAIDLPVQRIDFAEVAVTNAPWTLPSDVATAVSNATSGLVLPEIDPIFSAWAATNEWSGIAEEADPLALPALSAAAVAATNYTDAATNALAAGLAPREAAEWATNLFSRIEAVPVAREAAVERAVRDDVLEMATTEAGLVGYELHAVRERRDYADGGSVDGAFHLVPGGVPATLSGNVLSPSNRTGLVRVEFFPSDGTTTLRRTLSLHRAPPGTVFFSPVSETTNTWRRAQGDTLAALFRGIDTNGVRNVYRNGRGGVTRWTVTNLLAQQLYTPQEKANPDVCNPAFFSREIADLMRCQSVGRTDFSTGPETRPALFVSPHYAICAAHYTPSSGTFCLDRDNAEFATYRFTKVASTGDLQLLRADAAFPTNLLPSFVRTETLAQVSPSMCRGALGLYLSQHGTVHPCLADPLGPGGVWTTVRPDGTGVGQNGYYCNETYADLAPYAHVVREGDSGHAVCLVLAGRLVPVGLFYFASGSAPSLANDTFLDWIEAFISQDGEALNYLTAEDLRQ